MKINKKNFTLLALSAALMMPLACKKDFLSQTNRFKSTAEATFQKSGDVVALVNGIYDGYQNSDLLKKAIWYYANFQTHDFYNYGADVAWNNYQINSSFGALSTLWNNAYISIARANAAFGIIANAKEKGIVTSALADRLTGEAYFLRGMTYYYLAGSFGGVPLELNSVTDGLTPRSSQDDVFKQVVADMKKAETLLVSKSVLPAADLGRATKGAAYAYEGAAQMWLKDYTAALAAFNNTELTNNYHLLPTFMDVHEFDHQNNDESIFEIQFEVSGSQSWDGGWQNGGEVAWIDDFSWPEEISGFGYDYANPGLWYSYQAGDKRREATVAGPGDEIKSPGIIAKWGGIKGYPNVTAGFSSGNDRYKADDGTIINTVGTLTKPWYGVSDQLRSGYYNAKKWRDPQLTGSTGAQVIFGSQNQILMRYAEVLLSRAECKIRTGDVAGGMADLKLVRDRAFGGTAPAVMQDGLKYDGTAAAPITDPLQMVLSEYRHELTAEYSVFYDLRRAGPGVASAFIKAAYGTNSTSTPQPYPYGPTADGKPHGVYITTLPEGRDILPIPQQAIGLNPNLTQNPAYQ
ncbi:RagB/SusD family nutrient uptake outer membrane protein [Mucilaginibacter psychrotolerans]|uniref:RagB/SusD family nutrient uptake outer membrane protein n=1 Tax=Mucilaginibacter psychrotolerans TaxID=1524096 RepID=A0A4Y8SID1_9SPHI|nr:RagB/SusD family nutrient uptake outer membrane protein [Mucilaginibacter psychrotolerans]TFF38833.1 RagB/SusD family nutrient uptake outer membrane protein [Mucilaginibacter psychrotolerans]